MNIHEHQAKQILKEFGAPITNGVAVFSVDEIEEKIKSLTSNKIGAPNSLSICFA